MNDPYRKINFQSYEILSHVSKHLSREKLRYWSITFKLVDYWNIIPLSANSTK